jgi:hypothetical protein
MDPASRVKRLQEENLRFREEISILEGSKESQTVSLQAKIKKNPPAEAPPESQKLIDLMLERKKTLDQKVKDLMEEISVIKGFGAIIGEEKVRECIFDAIAEAFELTSSEKSTLIEKFHRYLSEYEELYKKSYEERIKTKRMMLKDIIESVFFREGCNLSQKIYEDL